MNKSIPNGRHLMQFGKGHIKLGLKGVALATLQRHLRHQQQPTLSDVPNDIKYHGTSGHDYFASGSDNDFIYGYNGEDELYGGGGNDHIDGGADNDWLYGNNGDDTIDGGSGHDTIDGGLGADILNGGSGDDTYVYNLGDGADEITDAGGDDGDRLYGNGGGLFVA
jgi:Ca2+-binding RTX toxin-like protein